MKIKFDREFIYVLKQIKLKYFKRLKTLILVVSGKKHR